MSHFIQSSRFHWILWWSEVAITWKLLNTPTVCCAFSCTGSVVVKAPNYLLTAIKYQQKPMKITGCLEGRRAAFTCLKHQHGRDIATVWGIFRTVNLIMLNVDELSKDHLRGSNSVPMWDLCGGVDSFPVWQRFGSCLCKKTYSLWKLLLTWIQQQLGVMLW